ncbi:achaete-scute homolog 1a-like [Argiope bruennichi]|uniref:achaete-scute homolog 1a-like n=1 Tax=Argiope bruennichi TaxID=94029 RepID=UPI0024950775|nr:achaete-scute homolog 1a-like [Argiope bruennichi]
MSSNCENVEGAQSFSFHSRASNFSDMKQTNMQASSRLDDMQDTYGEISSTNSKPVISVARRNERERKRVRLVNQGFAILRDKVPRDKCYRGRRSSKVETLRAAIMYIRQLQQILLESQTRFQAQNTGPCYAYFGGEALLNEPVVSGSDSYAVHNGFTTECTVTPSYNQFPNSLDAQFPDDVYAMPWFA